MDKALKKAFSKVHPAELARQLGCTRSAVCQWKRVPATRVLAVERITGVSRNKLRPDIYPKGI